MPYRADTYDEFKQRLDEGGFCNGTLGRNNRNGIEDQGRNKSNDTLYSDESKAEEGKCVFSGKPSTRRVIFARAY